MAHEENIKNDKCEKCLGNTIKKIKQFFYSIDTEGEGHINAEMLYDGLYLKLNL